MVKESLRSVACKPEMSTRVCYAVPDDATCAAAFDEMWPVCGAKLIELAGRRVEAEDVMNDDAEKFGKCLQEKFGAKFGAVKTPEGVAACQKAQASEKGG